MYYSGIPFLECSIFGTPQFWQQKGFVIGNNFVSTKICDFLCEYNCVFRFSHQKIKLAPCLPHSRVQLSPIFSQIALTDRSPVCASSILDGRVFATFYEVIILHEYLSNSFNLSGIHVIWPAHLSMPIGDKIHVSLDFEQLVWTKRKHWHKSNKTSMTNKISIINFVLPLQLAVLLLWNYKQCVCKITT